MSYAGRTVRFVHTVRLGDGRIDAGQEGICLSNNGAMLSVRIATPTSISIVWASKPFVDLVDDEIAWVNE